MINIQPDRYMFKGSADYIGLNNFEPQNNDFMRISYLMCVFCIFRRVFQKPEDFGVLINKQTNKQLLVNKPYKYIKKTSILLGLTKFLPVEHTDMSSCSV